MRCEYPLPLPTTESYRSDLLGPLRSSRIEHRHVPSWRKAEIHSQRDQGVLAYFAVFIFLNPPSFATNAASMNGISSGTLSAVP